LKIERELSTRIAGEISLSPNPSKAMKMWRETFGLTQSELARYMGTTPSVICDYESGRRRSPGTRIVRRFVEAVLRADAEKGHPVLSSYEKLSQSMDEDVVIDMREFKAPVEVGELARGISARLVAGEEHARDLVYGYTVIHSINAIIELSSEEFLRLYGHTPQRALIFTRVSYGRSPLIAIRVSPVKPKMLIMHGIDSIDSLAERIAVRERMPVAVTTLQLNEMLRNLRRWAS